MNDEKKTNSQDKTVCIYSQIIKKNANSENNDAKVDKVLVEKVLATNDKDSNDKTVGVFSNLKDGKKNEVGDIKQNKQTNEKKVLSIILDNENIDILRQIELTREELIKDNELLIDINDQEQLSVEIPKNITDSKKIILKGLGNINKKTGKKGDLIIQIRIIDSQEESKKWNKDLINYDYILFVGKNEKLKDKQKIMMIEKKKKIIVPIDDNLVNFEVFGLTYNSTEKDVLLVKVNTKQEAEVLNKKYFQGKLYLKAKESNPYKIVKYKKHEIPVKILQIHKDKYLMLGYDEDNDSYFKILVIVKNKKYYLINSGIYLLMIILTVIGYIILELLGLFIGLAIGLVLRYIILDKIN